MRNEHASKLARFLIAAGEQPDQDGSFMTTVHKAVINVRAVITGIDESVIPGLVDGEKRVVGYYDEAIEGARGDATLLTELETQRAAVQSTIVQMEQRATRAA